jgi:chemotaxis family two-component system response regulator Rcp1
MTPCNTRGYGGDRFFGSREKGGKVYETNGAKKESRDYMDDSKHLRFIEILLVEDNILDVKLTQEALKDSRMSIHLHIVRDGADALKFLRREGEFAESPRPDLIILDLNLPKVTGHEVLDFVKSEDAFSRIPVVVLTASHADEDILKSYKLHANCYIIKPLDAEKFFKIVRSIEDFWISIVKLPQ